MSEAARPPRPGFGYARRHGVALTGWRDERAEIACRDGVRVEILAELRRHLGAPLRFTAMPAPQFERLLRDLYEQGDDARAMVSDLDERLDLKALADELPEPEDLLESEDDAPIIRLINALLTEAVKEGASDIHIEPYENRLVVRFRIDGVLREVLAPQKAIANAVVSRIKVMA
jgi:general secretion pathway protein E